MKKSLKETLSITLCILLMLTLFISPSMVQAKTNDKTEVLTSLANDNNVTNLAKKYSTTPQVIDNDTVFFHFRQKII